jgi:3-methylcrotonyl-CoA carboxylase beta subunit
MSAPVLPTTLNPDDPQAQARAAHNRALAAELRAKVAEAALGGSEKSRERHTSRGKLLDIGAGTNEIRRMLIGRELIGAGA